MEYKKCQEVWVKAKFDSGVGSERSWIVSDNGEKYVVKNQNIKPVDYVMLPKFVVNYLHDLPLSSYTNPLSAIFDAQSPTSSSEVREWAAENQWKLIYALANGYRGEPEKKYNVIAWEDPKGAADTCYWFRDECTGMGAYSSLGNDDDDQQWTLKQIKEYGLEKFERVEVANEDC